MSTVEDRKVRSAESESEISESRCNCGGEVTVSELGDPAIRCDEGRGNRDRDGENA